MSAPKHPTQRGAAYRVIRKKGVYLGLEFIGAMLLPNGFHAEKCAETIRWKFRGADAFRVYGQDGAVYFCGSIF